MSLGLGLQGNLVIGFFFFFRFILCGGRGTGRSTSFRGRVLSL